MQIADVFMRVLADMKDFGADIVKKGGPAADKAGQTLGGKMTKGIKSSFSKANLGKSLTAGLGIGAGLGAVDLMSKGLSTMVGFMGDSIDAASDLNETMAKSGKVFGDQAGVISAWGDTTAETMGLSKQAAIAAAAGFGDLFNKMEETRDGSVSMSTNLVKLASDLASFNNLAGGSEEALEKLRAGLAGEAEPLRSVGVFLNENKVAAEATALGYEKVNGQFTDGAKIAARYSLIIKETASAQGDFADTSDDLANTQRRANAALEDAQAQFGQKLIPVMTLATEKGIELIDTIVALADALDAVAENAPGGSDAVGDFFAMLDPAKLLDVNARAENTLDLIDQLGIGTEETRKLWREWGLQVETTGDQVAGAAGRFESVGDAFAYGKRQADEGRPSIAEFGDRVEDVGVKADNAAKIVSRSLDDIIQDFKDAQSELEGIGSDAADAIYDPMIAKGKLAITEADIVKERAILASSERKLAEIDDLEASGRISKKEADKRRAELKETARQSKVRLAELHKDRIGHITELVTWGKLSAKESTKFLKGLTRDYMRETGKQKAFIFALIVALAELEAAQARARLGTGKASRSGALEVEPRALGGPVQAKRAYVVGEMRPELFVPDVPGRIIPYVPPAAEMAAIALPGGGSSTNISLQTYGMPMRAETPAAVVRRIRRAAVLGTVSPPPPPGQWEVR